MEPDEILQHPLEHLQDRPTDWALGEFSCTLHCLRSCVGCEGEPLGFPSLPFPFLPVLDTDPAGVWAHPHTP